MESQQAMQDGPSRVHERVGRRPLRAWLNRLRWIVLATVFLMLLFLPMLAVYQTYVAAHAYDLLTPSEKLFYDFMDAIVRPFTENPEQALNHVKGTTWSGTFWGFQITDPLAVLTQIAAEKRFYMPFLITALLPVAATLLFGRFYCGWICPATFLYELNDNFALWLRRLGIRLPHRRLDTRFKYVVLVMSLVAAAGTGAVVTAAFYPPAIIGREAYYAIAGGGFGAGAAFFLLTLLFDLLVARRGFCRYLCPGGALYSLLGRYRLVRIQREVTACNDCAKCNAVCEFGLNPMRDGFGQECNNCTACIAVCPTDALVFRLRLQDQPDQGPGHLGREYLRMQRRPAETPSHGRGGT